MSRKYQTSIILFAFFLTLNSVWSQSITLPIHFTLKENSITSAGIFSEDSILIRTLWSNRKLEAGTHQYIWDRKDDNGFIVLQKNISFRLLSNNVQYTWEGACIGNTSDSMVGPSKHRYFSRPNSMSIFGDFAYYSTGYAEGITSAYKFDLKNIQCKISILNGSHGDVDQMGLFTATDGKLVYWAGIDPFDSKTAFVYATQVSNDQEQIFSNGKSIAMVYGRTYPSVLDLMIGKDSSIPTGMAVQKNGIYLFVAHANFNELHVLNKTTGALIQNISITNPRQLCVDMNDNLWMISGTNAVQKFTVNSNGTLSSPILSISGLDEPLAFAVSPNNYLITICDGGASQQVKAFDNNSGAAVWTLGQYGGFTSDPAVTNNKFMFSHAPTLLKSSFIAFQADSSFWVGDPGNERIQHYAANRNFINCIASLPHSYSVEADKNDPTRVFNEYLEYKIDYSKTLAPNNGSWVLMRNWRAGIKANYYMDFKVDVLRNVITLSNGKTYAIITDRTNSSWPIPEVVELPATGHLRYTGVKFASFENFIIDNDGTARTLIADGNVGKTGRWESRVLTGFNNLNNPVWAAPTTIANTPVGAIEDPLTDANAYPSKTSGNMLVCFNPWDIKNNGKGTGYHLGAVKKGTNKWKWLACKSTLKEYQGPFPTDGTFDQGNGVVYPGGNAYAIDNSIFWNYHGEFWKNSQTNIWNQYNEDGLMIGQFGITSIEGHAYYSEAFAMGAGNVFSSSLVKVGSDYYIYHNDESVHAGVHRWKISGLNTIAEQSILLTETEFPSNGLNFNVYDGKDLDPLKLRSQTIQKQMAILLAPSEVADSNNYSAQYLGLIKFDSTGQYNLEVKCSKGVKVWVHHQLIVDAWKNKSKQTIQSIPFKANKDSFYTFRMDIEGAKTEVRFTLNGKTYSKVSFSCDSFQKDRTWLNLLENMPEHSIVENCYGWQVESLPYDSLPQNYWLCRSNIKTYSSDELDINLQFQKGNTQRSIIRNLETASKCKGAWQLSTTLNLENNSPNFNQDGFTMDIIDGNGLIICRFTEEMVLANNNQTSIYSLKFNEQDMVSGNYQQMYKLIKDRFDLYFSVDKGYCQAQIDNNLPMRCQILDPNADWRQPYALRFNFKGTQENKKQEVNISKLLFNIRTIPVIMVEQSDTLCQYQEKTIKTNSSPFIIWNNQAKTATQKIKETGLYWVNSSTDNLCFETSGKIHQTFYPTPVVVMTQSADTLKSNYNSGNSWYLNDVNINNKDSIITIQSKGKYQLLVSNSFGCVGQSEKTMFTPLLIFSAELNDSLYAFPNPSAGRIYIMGQISNCLQIEIYDQNGRIVKKHPCNNQLDLSEFNKGIYNIFIRQKNAADKSIKVLID